MGPHQDDICEIAQRFELSFNVKRGSFQMAFLCRSLEQKESTFAIPTGYFFSQRDLLQYVVGWVQKLLDGRLK